MDMHAAVTLRNLPDEFEIGSVESTLRNAVCEWLDYDQHPGDVEVKATYSPVEIKREGPLYCISDLHMGDGGPRDNFACGKHERDLHSFLDMVEKHDGRLIICGDLFELWQSNVSKVLTRRLSLLDRLARMGAIYVTGNHDADLNYFIANRWLAQAHPFFRTMCLDHTEVVGGRKFLFIHGHAADPYCAGDTPGLGRITAIYSGLAEDKHGGPMLDKYRTVEQKAVGRLERLVSLWERLRGKPDRNTAMNRVLRDIRDERAANIICGHTHFPGRIDNWHYNTGTWAERVNSFVVINQNGSVGVFDWADNDATPNHTELPI